LIGVPSAVGAGALGGGIAAALALRRRARRQREAELLAAAHRQALRTRVRKLLRALRPGS
jgi:hypothetical protein